MSALTRQRDEASADPAAGILEGALGPGMTEMTTPSEAHPRLVPVKECKTMRNDG
jgi:hypothetical protein